MGPDGDCMAQPCLSAAVALGWPNKLPGKTNLRVKCQTARERCPNSPTPRQALGTFDRSLQEKRRAIGHVACEEVREGASAGSPGPRSAPGVSANGGACRRRARPRHAPSRDRKSRVRQQISRGFHPMHTRVHSYSWGGGPYSYAIAGRKPACIRPIKGRKGEVCVRNLISG